jgi:lysozyme
MEKLIAQLKRHEGFRSRPYRDTVGKLTIGYGRNLDDVPLNEEELKLVGAASQEEVIKKGLSESQAELLLILEVQRLHGELGRKLPWFARLDEARQAVLLNMAFNLGTAGLLAFVNTLRCVKNGDYMQAAKNMLVSKWARQVGKRAHELALQMERGKYTLRAN